MHALHAILLWWYLIGALIPCGMVAYSLFATGKRSPRVRLLIAFLCGPPMWLLLTLCAACALAMFTRHKFKSGKPLVPPGTPAPSSGQKT